MWREDTIHGNHQGAVHVLLQSFKILSDEENLTTATYTT